MHLYKEERSPGAARSPVAIERMSKLLLDAEDKIPWESTPRESWTETRRNRWIQSISAARTLPAVAVAVLELDDGLYPARRKGGSSSFLGGRGEGRVEQQEQ